ncbi:MAG: 50S ribosomal protein L19, partial [Planctomycetes bacterium]|nr:50S ribosomal protein L19 [Planctomycetota bacterium]
MERSPAGDETRPVDARTSAGKTCDLRTCDLKETTMQRSREVELEQLKKEVPEFEIGDTVEVHVRLVEEQPASAPGRGRG